MSVLKGLGGLANGWIKFGLAIAAALWLGGQALDRVLPLGIVEKANAEGDARNLVLVSTTGAEENLNGPEKSLETSSADSELVPASSTRLVSSPRTLSAVEEIGGEVSSGVMAIAGNPVAHAGTAGLVGLLVGLLARPSLDGVNKKRRLAMARKRISLLDEDRQLLAENGVVSIPAPIRADHETTARMQIPAPQV